MSRDMIVQMLHGEKLIKSETDMKQLFIFLFVMNAMTAASQLVYDFNKDVFVDSHSETLSDNSVNVADYHTRYIQSEKQIIDTLEAERIFKEKYEPLLLEELQSLASDQERCGYLYDKNIKKVSNRDDILLLGRAYFAYRKVHPPYNTKGGEDIAIPIPIIFATIPIHTRVKEYTQEGIELTDRHLVKGKISKEVREYLKSYKTYLLSAVSNTELKIKAGWNKSLSKDEIPYRNIKTVQLNPNYIGLYYDDPRTLNSLEYNQHIKGWESIKNINYIPDIHETFPNNVYYKKIRNYRAVFRIGYGDDGYIYDVFDKQGRLVYIPTLRRSIAYEKNELNDVKRLVYLKDYNNNKYNIKAQSTKTNEYIKKHLCRVGGLYSVSDNLSVLCSAWRMGFIPGNFNDPMVAADVQIKENEKNVVGVNYIKQLESDHMDDFKYLYMIERLSQVSFRVTYVNGKTLKPSYCAEITYSTGKEPYTVTYSTKLVPIPSNVPPIK